MQDPHYFGIDDEGSTCARINRRLLAGKLCFFFFADAIVSTVLLFLKND